MRDGGVFGRGGLGRRVVEASVQRTLGVDLDEQESLRAALVEAVGDLRAVEKLSRRLGWLALHAVGRWASGQDETPERRLDAARRVRQVAKRDSQMLYAVRLRNAFAFGQGVPVAKAVDEDVQTHLDDVAEAKSNKAELFAPAAQWRFGKDLWELCNVYFVVFADGFDGRVLLGSLQHDQVRSVQRDPKVWRRVLWYVVTEYVYDWDYAADAPKSDATPRTVYYESLEGMAELEEEVRKGRTDLPTPPPASRVRPGRILHVAINRGRESAFGEPEMRTNLRWASAFNDLLAGQVEKAKAAQQYLMKVTAGNVRTEQQLTDTAMRAVGRRSPLANAALDGLDDPASGAPLNANARPGSQWWESDALTAEPFNLESGASSARQDMESAAQAFASGTNFPGHYFFGDPGSLAGSMAVELPVLKLSEVDQRVIEDTFRTIYDLRIERGIRAGTLTERRPPTDEEVAAQVEVGPDGLVERDLSYELAMPDALRRNLPELMQLIVDTATTFDPTGQSEVLNRALLGHALELMDFSDIPALMDRYFAEADQRQQEADAMARELAAGGPGPAPGGGGPPTSTGPDGRQHTSKNPYGARQQSTPVVEAATRKLWALVQEALEEDEREAILAAAGENGGAV